MHLEVREESVASLRDYASIPIAFEVAEVLDVEVQQGESGGFTLRSRTLDVRHVKDYDALDGGPARWARRFDLSNWGLLGAYIGGDRVGGAAVAFDTPGLVMCEDRTDLAVLWDIRVSPGHRGRGIGSALVTTAEAWSVARACRQLKVETQNVNVPACRFYSRHGFVLGAIHRFAYPSLPEEVQLLWYKDLSRKQRPCCAA